MAFVWETLDKIHGQIQRTKIPGGWFVRWFDYEFDKSGGHQYSIGAMVFYPDPEHSWDGNTLP